ncbi:MAG TPA: DedA family protein [Streptosporangiaceae bacterium]|nr:DedA family protein [Streptosporangiaceae bacterium]
MGVPPLPGALEYLAPVITRYGYLAVGGLLLIEDFGVPVPGETVMIIAAVYAGAGRLSIVWVAVIAAVAAITGDNIGYAIGRCGGQRLVARYGRYVLLTPARVARAEVFFARHGSAIVPAARFFDGLRQANGIIAGMAGMSWVRFGMLNALGAAVWVGAWTTIGDLAGHHIGTLYSVITRYGAYELAAVAVIIAVVCARLVVRRHLVRHRCRS